ncbi:MAG TPA: hypothetical protein VFZ91_16890 [Allosphingosinicella sp.]
MQKLDPKTPLKSWTKPRIRRMGSGSAELGSTGSTDGTGLS